jgi:hypothetical protein
MICPLYKAALLGNTNVRHIQPEDVIKLIAVQCDKEQCALYHQPAEMCSCLLTAQTLNSVAEALEPAKALLATFTENKE